jgi:hypothetical protein
MTVRRIASVIRGAFGPQRPVADADEKLTASPYAPE